MVATNQGTMVATGNSGTMVATGFDTMIATDGVVGGAEALSEAEQELQGEIAKLEENYKMELAALQREFEARRGEMQEELAVCREARLREGGEGKGK